MISFIIPAFNESKNIRFTLNTIKQFAPSEDYEIVVVDNNSTDNTMQLAIDNGAIVVTSNAKTIGEARNAGVNKAIGDILIFIDADVLLTESWQAHIDKQVLDLRKNPIQISGSRCHPPENNNWFNLYWFRLMNNQVTTYINSGHLITTRILFDKIDGFTASLKTAEDHDFCKKAVAIGAKLLPNFLLITVHDGYPKTLGQFFKRERWHGREDFNNVNSFIKSKVAIVATLNLFLFTCSTLNALITINPLPLLYYLLTMVVICLVLSMIKFGRLTIQVLLANTITHFVYFWGRSFSLIDKLSGKYTKRFREQG